jgi:tRNA A37 threonylcarbamoyladenosine dehydratase
MSKAQTFKFKLLKNNVVKLNCNEQTFILDASESEELLTSIIEKTDKNKSNVINFPKRVN